MKTEKNGAKVKPENTHAVDLYLLGYSIAEIAQLQNRETGAISSAIHRARKRKPNAEKLKKQYNFMANKTKLAIKAGSLIPTITEELCPDIQKWVLQKTAEHNYDSIASFFTDLAAEAYFADQ